MLATEICEFFSVDAFLRFADIFSIIAAAAGRPAGRGPRLGGSLAPGRPAGGVKKRMVELLDGRPFRSRFGVRFDLDLMFISISF